MEAVRQTPPLRLACEEVDLSIVPIQSDEICVYALASMMEKKGWNTFTSCRPKSAPCPPLCVRPLFVRVRSSCHVLVIL